MAEWKNKMSTLFIGDKDIPFRSTFNGTFPLWSGKRKFYSLKMNAPAKIKYNLINYYYLISGIFDCEIAVFIW